MMSPTVALISGLRALVEVAGLALLGQGVLFVLAGARREGNLVYVLLRTVSKPVVLGVRAVLPRVIVDRHVPVVAFFLLFWLWLALAYVRQLLCQGGAVCG